MTQVILKYTPSLMVKKQEKKAKPDANLVCLIFL